MEHCIECEATFPDQERLVEHKIEKHYIAFACKICQHTFGNREDVREHVRNKHHVDRTNLGDHTVDEVEDQGPQLGEDAGSDRSGTPASTTRKEGEANKKRRLSNAGNVDAGGDGAQEGASGSQQTFRKSQNLNKHLNMYHYPRAARKWPDTREYTAEDVQQMEQEEENFINEEEEDDAPLKRRRSTSTQNPGFENALKMKNKRSLQPTDDTENKDPPPPKYQCTQCPSGFPFEILLQQHMSVHLGASVNVCHVCKNKLSGHTNAVTRHILRIHMPSTVAPLRGLLSCEHCPTPFAKAGYAFDHYVRRHLNKLDYVPEPLGTPMTSKRSRSQSIKETRVFEDGPLKCNDCPQSFFFQELLQVHTNTQHSKDKMFVCHICSAFNTQMNSHVVALHMKDSVLIPLVASLSGSLVCPVCDKGFMDVTATAKHIVLKHEWAAHARIRPVPEAVDDIADISDIADNGDAAVTANEENGNYASGSNLGAIDPLSVISVVREASGDNGAAAEEDDDDVVFVMEVEGKGPLNSYPPLDFKKETVDD